jgi:hypothetical protein
LVTMSLLKDALYLQVPSQSNHGPVIVLMHQYALVEDGTTIHSFLQMEWNQGSVDDWSQHMGGHQWLLTLNGYQISLNMCCGLAYMDMHPFTDNNWDWHPHIILTLKTPWDLRPLSWAVWWPQLVWVCGWPCLLNPDFDAHGDYHHCVAQSAASLFTDEEAPDDNRDHNSSTWASLMEEALDGIVTSCVLQANLHCQLSNPLGPW